MVQKGTNKKKKLDPFRPLYKQTKLHGSWIPSKTENTSTNDPDCSKTTPSHSSFEAFDNQMETMSPHSLTHKRLPSKSEQQEQQTPKRMRLKNDNSKSILGLNKSRDNILKNGPLNNMERNTSDNTDLKEHGSNGGSILHNSPLVNTNFQPIKSLLPTCQQMKSPLPITITILNKNGCTSDKIQIENTIAEHGPLFGTYIDLAFNGGDIKLNSQTIQEMVSCFCRSGGAPALFSIISDSLHANAGGLCQKLELMAPMNINFLSELLSQWHRYQKILTEINGVCSEINYHYILKETQSKSLLDFGLRVYADILSQNIKIRERTISNIIYLIKCERLQIPTDTKLTESAMGLMCENLPAYIPRFEKELLTTTRLYYNDRSLAARQSMNIHNYIGFAIKMILNEPTLKQQYRKYLFKSTVSITDIVMKELLLKHIDDIVEKGFEYLVELEQHVPLKALYTFISRYSEIAHIQAAFGRYIKNECEMLCRKHRIDDPDCHDRSHDGKNRSLLFVSSLLQLKSRMNSILGSCFCDDTGFGRTLKDSFEVAINLYQASSAQHIACYLDDLLESPWPFSHSVSRSLDDGIGLLRSLQSEEIFKAHYRIDLGRRLLQQQQDTVRKDTYMAQRLRSECGAIFTKDIDVMIEDIKISHKQGLRFSVGKRASSKESRSRIEMNVRILSRDSWSFRSWSQNIRLPTQLLEHQEIYHQFYQQENKNRRLNWISSLGTCTIKARYPKCKIQLTTTEIQAVILLLFNNTNIRQLTLKQICQQTGLDEEYVKKSLDILSSQKLPLLIKRRQQQQQHQHQRKTHHKGSKLVSIDYFSYNTEFKSIGQTFEIQDISAELTSSSLKTRNQQPLFTHGERVRASIMKVLKEHRKLSMSKLQEMVGAGIPNQMVYTNVSVDPALIQSELDFLVGRDLVVYNATNGLYLYCE